MDISTIIKKLIDVAEGRIQHRLIDCSQPCGTPDEFHDVKNCEACKILIEANQLQNELKDYKHINTIACEFSEWDLLCIKTAFKSWMDGYYKQNSPAWKEKLEIYNRICEFHDVKNCDVCKI